MRRLIDQNTLDQHETVGLPFSDCIEKPILNNSPQYIGFALARNLNAQRSSAVRSPLHHGEYNIDEGCKSYCTKWNSRLKSPTSAHMLPDELSKSGHDKPYSIDFSEYWWDLVFASNNKVIVHDRAVHDYEYIWIQFDYYGMIMITIQLRCIHSWAKFIWLSYN